MRVSWTVIEGERRPFLTSPILKKVIRIQFVVAEKLIDAAVQPIRAGFDADIHDGAGTAVKLR